MRVEIFDLDRQYAVFLDSLGYKVAISRDGLTYVEVDNGLEKKVKIGYDKNARPFVSAPNSIADLNFSSYYLSNINLLTNEQCASAESLGQLIESGARIVRAEVYYQKHGNPKDMPEYSDCGYWIGRTIPDLEGKVSTMVDDFHFKGICRIEHSVRLKNNSKELFRRFKDSLKVNSRVIYFDQDPGGHETYEMDRLACLKRSVTQKLKIPGFCLPIICDLRQDSDTIHWVNYVDTCGGNIPVIADALQAISGTARCYKEAKNYADANLLFNRSTLLDIKAEFQRSGRLLKGQDYLC